MIHSKWATQLSEYISLCDFLYILQGKRHVKKHLFSDTDTDFVTSEVSWLTESSKKTIPKVTKYSRQAAVNSKPLSSLSSILSLKKKHILIH